MHLNVRVSMSAADL